MRLYNRRTGFCMNPHIYLEDGTWYVRWLNTSWPADDFRDALVGAWEFGR